MKLSICISTYNRNNSLQECVRSINKLVNNNKLKINIFHQLNSLISPRGL